VREVVGVEKAEPSLFELPTRGRLLVNSSVGPWIVEADGSKRLLGNYRDATWSPFGRFVAAVRDAELVALEPDGSVRWALPRPGGVTLPRWGGTRADTRIAYVSGSTLRVVGGDGKGDRLLAGAVAPVAPAWRPGRGHVVAYSAPGGRIVVRDADSGRTLWRGRELGRVTSIEWSSDARRLFVLRLSRADLYTGDGRLWSGIRVPRGRVTALAFRPGSHAHAYSYTRGDRFQAAVVAEPSRPLLTGRGNVDGILWAPDGRWALLSWPNARQWVFVRAEGRPQVVAIADVATQFRSSTFPELAGWCCS
jgi:outer membrane protein assembly factor BamB